MTDAELTLLSLFASGARTVGDIHTLIDERGLRDWLAIGRSSVVTLLENLEAQNLLTSDQATEIIDAPTRRRYTLTEAGRGVLHTAITDLLQDSRALGTGFELGLANLHVLNPAQVRRVLRSRQQELQMQYQAAQRLWSQRDDTALNDGIRALYTHSLHRMQAELHWLDEFLDDWETRYPATAPDTDNAGDSTAARTRRFRSPTPPTLKMLQRLHRPPSSDTADETDEADTPDDNST